MAVASYAAYLAKAAAPWQRVQLGKSTASVLIGQSGIQPGWLHSFWSLAPTVGATPTTAVACTRSTAGAAAQFNSSGVQRVARWANLDINLVGQAQSNVSAEFPVTLYLMDRLSHQGGLSGTTTGTITTNLPTAALTRYTDGLGVQAAIHVYSTIGSTPTTITASYTNQAGVAGRTSPLIVFGGTDNRGGHRQIALPLQAGDLGVRSVESVTVAGSTGTTGNYGVVLFKVLDCAPVMVPWRDAQTYDAVLHRGGHMPQAISDACLYLAATCWPTTVQPPTCEIQLIEE